jgi:hypothetical protein
MDHKQIKLWALYPYYPNRTTYNRTASGSARYDACEKHLVGGVYAITYPGQGLVFSCLHATWTIRGGSLFGVTLAVAENAVLAADILLSDILAGKVTKSNDIQAFLQSLHACVVAGMDSSWQALDKLCDLELGHFKKAPERSILVLLNKILLLLKSLRESCNKCCKKWELHFPFSLKLEGKINGTCTGRKRKKFSK